MQVYKDLYSIPLSNFYKIVETGNLWYLQKFSENTDKSDISFFDKPKKLKNKELEELWGRIYEQQEYIFIPQDFKDSIKIAILEGQYKIQGKPVLQTRLDILKAKQAKREQREVNNNIDMLDDLIAFVERYFNFKIDINKFTYSTKKFQNLLKYIKEDENRNNSNSI